MEGVKSIKAYIIIDNKVLDARDYQADALEKTIKEKTGNKIYEPMEYIYENETIKFSIVKQETRLADGFGVYDDLSFSEKQSLYVFTREDGTNTYISQNRETLIKLLRN